MLREEFVMMRKQLGIVLLGVCFWLAACGNTEADGNPGAGEVVHQEQLNQQVGLKRGNDPAMGKELEMVVLEKSVDGSGDRWSVETEGLRITLDTTDSREKPARLMIGEKEYPFSYAGYEPVAERPEAAFYDVNGDGVLDVLMRGEAYRTELRQDVYLSDGKGGYIELGDMTWNRLEPLQNAVQFETRFADHNKVHVICRDWNIDSVLDIKADDFLEIALEEGIYDEKGEVTEYGKSIVLDSLQGRAVRYLVRDDQIVVLRYEAEIETGYSEYGLGQEMVFTYLIGDAGYVLESVTVEAMTDSE